MSYDRFFNCIAVSENFELLFAKLPRNVFNEKRPAFRFYMDAVTFFKDFCRIGIKDAKGNAVTGFNVEWKLITDGLNIKLGLFVRFPSEMASGYSDIEIARICHVDGKPDAAKVSSGVVGLIDKPHNGNVKPGLLVFQLTNAEVNGGNYAKYRKGVSYYFKKIHSKLKTFFRKTCKHRKARA